MEPYIDKIVYINLEHRLDKKVQLEEQLYNFDLKFERFNGIHQPENVIGCSKSHLEVLKLAKKQGYRNVLILEDDFMFIVSKEEFYKNISLLFESKIEFDVCMLSYNLIKSNMSFEIPFLTKVLEVQTASGYIVNNSMYDKLIELYEWAIPLLESTKQHWIYSNDQIWKKLQKNNKWYCFTTRIGKQRPSYSDNGETWADIKW